MRALTVIMLSLLSILGTVKQEYALYRKVRELNSEIESRESRLADFRARMSIYRSELEALDRSSSVSSDSLKWELAYSLFAGYSYVNVDSTLHYAHELERYSSIPMLRRRTEVCFLRVRAIAENLDGLYDDIMAYDPLGVDEAFVNRSCIQLQRASSVFTDDEQIARYVMGRAMEYEGLREDIRLRYLGIFARFDGDYAAAQALFERAYEAAQTVHLKALAAYNIASCYKYHGNSDMYCYWLAESAINDIQVPVREYYSLYNLARELFDRGQVNLAIRYMQFVMQDAVNGHWESRINMSAADEVIFGSAFLRSQREKMIYMWLFILILVLLAAYVTVSRIRSHAHNKALIRLASQMREMNARLKDEGVIKEKYLFNYMEMLVSRLGDVDEYKHELRRVLKDEGTDALIANLRSHASTNVYKEFYAGFDRTFLALYPGFVKGVNKLMKDDCTFPESASLNTDLRILATIRLGFKDSGQIARFLNLPASSVYTRRSAMRRNSICGKAGFEDSIRKII